MLIHANSVSVRFFVSFIIFMSLAFFGRPIFAQDVQDRGKKGSEVGNSAPDFSLPNTKDEQVRLSSYKGSKNVVLVFYRGEF